MKKNLLITIYCLLLVMFASCESWTDVEADVLPETQISSLTPEEEAALIEYKNSDHKLFFAWFNYTPENPSMQSRISGIPDSLDIVSFFTGYVDNEQNRRDVKFLQERRGTKVLVTMWPDPYFSTKGAGSHDLDSMKIYARNLAESVIEWGLDGFDLDYEPNFGGDEYFQDMMRTFIDVMSEYMGPMCKEEYKVNGKHRLLVVDGQWKDAEYADRFDYFIGQAYDTKNAGQLDQRLSGGGSDFGIGFPNEKRIFTEWTSDANNYFGHGGDKYTYFNKETNEEESIPSLWGMAHYATEGEIAGCGVYVLQFAYAEGNHMNKPTPPNNYFYAREAIQIMNPATLKRVPAPNEK
ncbi:glycoside hydrolase family 18 [Dysgonomonas massiliensis]|uniref:glycoside hydrolase family 18 n=1 Tax=Dysgonomonas massiliensis TaxID=2040292 RepID=UPI000C770BD2|nr:glycoside hydrolase family 18 [Dysgonomonas massiliensis]